MTVQILGSRIHRSASYEQTYKRMLLFLHQRSGSGYVTVNNAYTLVEAILHSDYRTIINESLLSLPDGRPISLIGRLRGAVEIQRIFGPTLFEKTLEWGQKDGLRHFFFGTRQETLDSMVAMIRLKFPHAEIAGMLAPPFRPFTSEENDAFLAKMRACRPDIIWVALGAPKQERWIYSHYRQLGHGLFVGIGAGFAYLTGAIRHAPQWMKNWSLEWLYRWSQEPLRLAKRYTVYNSLFILFLFMELIGLLKFKPAAAKAKELHEVQIPQDLPSSANIR